MIQTPYRYDFVGSFLRPDVLKQARKDWKANKISAEKLKEIEDEQIRLLVQKQKAAGFHVLTDGEFRRETWHLDFMWGFKGIAHQATKTGLPFNGEAAMIDDTYLVINTILLWIISNLFKLWKMKIRLQNKQFLHRHNS